MFNPTTAPLSNGNAIRRLILISGLIVLFGLVLPATTLAGPPLPHGTEECAGCHLEETTAWQNSPHAEAAGEQHVFGVTCEGCHGSYAKKHPHLVDSSVCKECHTDVFEQWQDSSHAQAGLECIECHLSHSQQFRLTDDNWCGSCHRKQLEKPVHNIHQDKTSVTCAKCHLAFEAASHEFSGVPSEHCTTCHGQGIYAEECIDCHSQEATAWRDSPHAEAVSHGRGATCQSCHGPFVDNHLPTDEERPPTDSSVCKDCHTGTFEQWVNSRHARNDVSCTGCHLSHSQQFRLTDEALCGSCHRDRLEDFSHSTHSYAEVTCVDCHIAPISDTDEAVLVDAGEVGDTKPVPNHNFSSGVPSESCARCHGESIHTAALHSDVSQGSTVNLVAMADRVPKLTAELEAARQRNEWLESLALVSLGGGIGVGVMMGALFVLGARHITRRGMKK